LTEFARRENVVEFSTQRFCGLVVQDLEDRPPECLAPRDALQAGLARVVPGLDAVFPIDDVEADGKRIDHLFNEVTLLDDLPGSCLEFVL